MRILIADDEAVIRLGLKAMLTDAGHTVVASAPNGRIALEMAEQYKPELAILDIKIPEVDGLETARYLMKKNPLPIVMLTAFSQRDLIAQAQAAPVFAYLVKPVKEESLMPTLELACARFAEWKILQKETQDLKASLVARDLIEEAKRKLMERDRLSEKDAFLKIRRASRARRVPMEKIAQEIMKK